MSLSLSDRSQLYDQIGKLLVAGFPFLRAVETMLTSRPRGATRRILEKWQASALRGATIADSFADPTLPFSAMETSLIAACERSGQLQRGCEFLARYYARFAAIRGQIIRKTIYPIFMLHFGIILLAIPKLFQGKPPSFVAIEIGMQLGSFYVFGLVIYLMARGIMKLAILSPTLDWFLGLFPLLGRLRNSLVLARFCTTYQMQLDAGVNVMDSLDAASKASASARLVQGIRKVLPEIRAGLPVAPELAKLAIFPTEFVRSLVIAEQTGTLDAELLRAAEEAEVKALQSIESFGDWMPKIIYLIIVLFLGWNIISGAKSSTNQLNQLLEGDL